MLFNRVASLALAACTAVQGMSIGGQGMKVKPYKREVLQDLVTWDEVRTHGRLVLEISC